MKIALLTKKKTFEVTEEKINKKLQSDEILVKISVLAALLVLI